MSSENTKTRLCRNERINGIERRRMLTYEMFWGFPVELLYEVLCPNLAKSVHPAFLSISFPMENHNRAFCPSFQHTDQYVHLESSRSSYSYTRVSVSIPRKPDSSSLLCSLWSSLFSVKCQIPRGVLEPITFSLWLKWATHWFTCSHCHLSGVQDHMTCFVCVRVCYSSTQDSVSIHSQSQTFAHTTSE